MLFRCGKYFSKLCCDLRRAACDIGPDSIRKFADKDIRVRTQTRRRQLEISEKIQRNRLQLTHSVSMNQEWVRT